MYEVDATCQPDSTHTNLSVQEPNPACSLTLFGLQVQTFGSRGAEKRQFILPLLPCHQIFRPLGSPAGQMKWLQLSSHPGLNHPLRSLLAILLYDSLTEFAVLNSLAFVFIFLTFPLLGGMNIFLKFGDNDGYIHKLILQYNLSRHASITKQQYSRLIQKGHEPKKIQVSGYNKHEKQTKRKTTLDKR